MLSFFDPRCMWCKVPFLRAFQRVLSPGASVASGNFSTVRFSACHDLKNGVFLVFVPWSSNIRRTLQITNAG